MVGGKVAQGRGRGRGEGKKVNAAMGKGITDKCVLQCSHLRKGLLVLCQNSFWCGALEVTDTEVFFVLAPIALGKDFDRQS